MVLNDSLLKAISWTLLHSVWQGFILALLAGLVIVMTKKSASALRYNWFAGLFLVFMIGVGMTFNYEFQNENRETITRINLPIIANDTTVKQSQFLIPTNLSDTIINYLNHNAGIIVCLWFLIFSFKCFGIFRSLSNVYRVRNYKTQTPPEYWTDKLKELSERIQLKKQIRLLESRLVKVPSVVGFFKPVILIPVGLLSHLPHEQIEAILLHELAHIRRKDYFINLLQSFAEVVFFFNPGLLWLSALLKDERENCCDDIAIGITQSKSKFIHALVSFEEYNLKQNQLAMGFGRNKNQLLNRAKRIIHNDNQSLNAVEKTFLSVSLVLIAVIILACSNTKMDAIQKSETAQQLIIDARKADLMANMENARLQKQNAIVQAENNKECIKDSKTAIADSLTLIEDEKTRIADTQAAINDSKAYEEDKKAAAIEAQLASQIKKGKHSTQSETITTTSENGAKTGKRVTVRTGISGEDLPNNINVDQLTNNIISDLIAANVISNTKHLSYKLSELSLIVNGIAQPQNIYKKLRQKYVKSKDISICYNYEYNGNAVIPEP